MGKMRVTVFLPFPNYIRKLMAVIDRRPSLRVVVTISSSHFEAYKEAQMKKLVSRLFFLCRK